MKTTQPGWTYEPADYSVGIFGEGWIHEDCPFTNGEEVDTYEEEVVDDIRLDSDNKRIIYVVKVSCTCGASFTYDEPNYAIDNEDWLHMIEEYDERKRLA